MESDFVKKLFLLTGNDIKLAVQSWSPFGKC